MGIGDWGLGIGPNPQSPIPNPQSPIPNPQSPIPNPHYKTYHSINEYLITQHIYYCRKIYFPKSKWSLSSNKSFIN